MSVSAKEVARQKGVIVIVGGFKKMFPQHWDDPRCCFIDSQHADRANIPVNAKAVVFTKALSHSAFFKLQKQAKVIGVDVIHGQNTGELKRTLDQLFIRFESELAGTSPKVVKINEVNPQPPSKDIGVTRARWQHVEEVQPAVDPSPVVAAVKRPYGAAAAWIRQQFMLNPDITLEEMFKLAEDSKIGIPHHTLRTGYSKYHSTNPDQPAPKKQVVPEPAPKVQRVAAAPAFLTKEDIVEKPRLVDDENLRAWKAEEAAVHEPVVADPLLWMLDEAITRQRDLAHTAKESIAALELVREEATKLAGRKAELQQKLNALMELLK